MKNHGFVHVSCTLFTEKYKILLSLQSLFIWEFLRENKRKWKDNVTYDSQDNVQVHIWGLAKNEKDFFKLEDTKVISWSNILILQMGKLRYSSIELIKFTQTLVIKLRLTPNLLSSVSNSFLWSTLCILVNHSPSKF